VTGNDLISGSMKLLGLLSAGDTATGTDAQDALSRLNDLIDAWQLERLFIFTVARTTKTLTSGTASYTIGSGGDINIDRPTWIDRGALIYDPSAATPAETPLELFTDQRWQEIRQKTLQSGQPAGIWYDHGFTAGLGRIFPHPIPNTSTTQLVLYAPGAAVGQFADLTTAYTFPPGYARMLRYNLAIELAPEFGRAIDPVIAATAMSSMSAVKRANNRPRELKCGPEVLGRSGGFDIRTGNYR
jgi:hypothetical protein